MITLKLYQDYCKIPTGQTDSETIIQISNLLKLPLDTMTKESVDKELLKFLEKIQVSKKKPNYIKLDKWYKVDRELYKLTFGQWAMFDRIMRVVDKENVSEYIHLVTAVFLRPCRFYKFFPSKFNSEKLKDIGNVIQEKMSVETALELINFFFLYTWNSANNTKINYLEELEKGCWVTKEVKI